MSKRIAVITGGGDTSALNATLKGIALEGEHLGFELIGFMEGWRGLLKGGHYFPLTSDLIDEECGGTILKSSRTNLLADNKIDEAIDNLRRLKIDAIIPIGGDDTMSVGAELSKQFPATSVTKTIDNDVGMNPPEGTSVDYLNMINYFCPGYPTAASRLINYVQDLRTTAYSHNRFFFVEAMGRDAGWLTLASAYGNPDLIVVPEMDFDPDRLADAIRQKFIENGNVITVVSEGIRNHKGELMIASKTELDAFGHTRPGGCSEIIAEAMRLKLSNEFPNSTFRHVIMGYLLRCGQPIKLDLDCAKMAGKMAVMALDDGNINSVSTISRTETGFETVLRPFDEVVKRDKDKRVIRRSLDMRFYNAEDYHISAAGIEYFRPIFGDFRRTRTYTSVPIDFRVV